VTIDPISARVVDRVNGGGNRGTAGPTAREIAATIGQMVTAGDLAPGDRLPTVRALADRLGVSSSTVSDAWRILAHHGTINTARRNGTTVRASRVSLAGRHWQVPVPPGSLAIDLSAGTPDAELLPSLGSVLRGLHSDMIVTSYIDSPLLGSLEAELVARWPFEPERLTVVDGAMDALDRLVSLLIGLGDTVVVEDPTFPPLLDMLELAGATVVGVELDSQGPIPQQFAAAMDTEPVAVILQPRAHNPTGVSLSSERTLALSEVLERSGSKPWIIEDDHSAGACEAPVVSLGLKWPSQVIHIRSFSKSHGPDLRIAAIGGAGDPIAAVVQRRQLGAAWTSRVLQHLLLNMLVDAGTEALVARAAAEYGRRRRIMAEVLAENGTIVGQGTGLNMWLPVNDENRACVALAVAGIGVAPGRPFRVTEPERGGHIRLSLGEARGSTPELTALAEKIAIAAKA